MIESKQIKVLTGHSNVIMSIMSLDDNNNLVSADDRGEIIIWDVLPVYLYITSRLCQGK